MKEDEPQMPLSERTGDRVMFNQQSDPLMGTPRSDISSGADMNELKMALGGLSDRSIG